jgi:hypothetical protein
MMMCKVVDETAPLRLRILPQFNTKFRPVEVAWFVLADLTLKKVQLNLICYQLPVLSVSYSDLYWY